jgi:MFS transporter, YNFM family, putative membrane transport protein
MPAPATHLFRGTQEYRRTSGTLFAAGFMAFALLYVAQGILPAVSRDFSVSPAAASLTLSGTTLPLAVAVVAAASWSEAVGRRSFLIGGLLAAAGLTLAAATSPTFLVLLALRVLIGLVLAGVPAAAMAYVAEEFHPSGLGSAMGLYISGTGLGGMIGRLSGGLVASALSWRVALAAVGGLCLLGSMWVAVRLPSSRNFVPVLGGLRARVGALRGPLRDPVIIRLAACGFVLMGGLVSYFNYLQYRLAEPPFALPPALGALVFGVYVFGTVSANWMGRLTDRRGRRGVLYLGVAIMAAGALASLSARLPVVLAGTAAVVFGFFGAHSVASGWVNARATSQRAQASSLYLFAYHLGSGMAGYAGGLFFGAFGWSGEVGMVIILLAVGVLTMAHLPSKPDRQEAADAP